MVLTLTSSPKMMWKHVFIAGVAPYILEILGEDHLKPFTAAATNSHADSVYDAINTKFTQLVPMCGYITP